MFMPNDFEATEPLAPVVQISDRTPVPLTKARKVQVDPLSVIELIEDEVLPRAQVTTTVLPMLLEYGIERVAGAVLVPVLL